MTREDIIEKVNSGFGGEIKSNNSFRKRFLLMQNIKGQIPDLPEYLIYYILRDLDKQINFDKNKNEFIKAFLSRISSVLPAGTKE